MKKALIVLLILAVAGGAFAQSFNGYVETGAKITFKDDIPVEANDGDGPEPVRAQVTFTNGDDETWGITVGIRSNVTAEETDKIFLSDANGWVKFANIFKLTAGKGVGGDWEATTAVFDENGIGGSAAGAKLNVTPIDGLDLGVVFGYPNTGVAAGKIGNFLSETGIGAKFDAGILVAGTRLKFFSEETTDYPGTDANWLVDVKIPVLDLFNVHVESKIYNLLGKKDKMDVWVGEKIEGSIVGLSWGVKSTQNVTADPLFADLDIDLGYELPINDKATLSFGADAGFTLLNKFSFDDWDVSAKLGYNFNGNVSTAFLFEVDGVVDPSDITPWFRWTIKYSF